MQILGASNPSPLKSGGSLLFDLWWHANIPLHTEVPLIQPVSQESEECYEQTGPKQNLQTSAGTPMGQERSYVKCFDFQDLSKKC